MLFPPLNPPPPTPWDVVGNFFLLGAAIAVAAFGFFYAFYFNWRSTPAGQAVLLFVTGLIAWSLHTVITRFMGGDWLFRDVARAVVYGYLMFVSLWLLATLYRIWRAGNHPTTAEEILQAKQRRVTRQKDRTSLWGRFRDREPGARR